MQCDCEQHRPRRDAEYGSVGHDSEVAARLHSVASESRVDFTVAYWAAVQEARRVAYSLGYNDAMTEIANHASGQRRET